LPSSVREKKTFRFLKPRQRKCIFGGLKAYFILPRINLIVFFFVETLAEYPCFATDTKFLFSDTFINIITAYPYMLEKYIIY
jgi:hypothetical protein